MRRVAQQHPPPCCCWTLCPGVIVDDLFGPAVVEAPMLRDAFVSSCARCGTLNSPVFNLLGHCQECLLNIGSILSRGLQERNSQLVCKFLCGRLSKRFVHSRVSNAPLLHCTQRPSCLSNRTCFQPTICWHPRMRSGRFLGAIAWHSRRYLVRGQQSYQQRSQARSIPPSVTSYTTMIPCAPR